MNQRKWIVLVFITQLIILALTCITYRNMKPISYPASILTSDVGILNGNGIYEISEESGAQDSFVLSTLTPLKKGIYDIYVYYQTDTDNNRSDIVAQGNTYAPVKSNGAILHADNSYETYRIWVTDSIEGLQVKVSYGGQGSLSVSGVEIKQSKTTMTYHAAWLAIAFMILDLFAWVLWNWKQGKKCLQVSTKKRLFFFILISMLASYPLFTNYVIDGIDIEFHLTRIEGIKDGLLAGDFPVRIQPSWLNGHGYAVSVFYGDLLLYIPAVLRIIGFSLQSCYKFYIILINALTCLFSWYGLKKIFKEEEIAILGSALFTLSYYQMMELYVRAGIGSISAYAFVPLAVCGLIQIYQNRDRQVKGLWLMPVIGFTGMLQSHLLTFELVALFTIVICLLLFRWTFQRTCFLNLLKVVIFTVLLNLFYLVPFLDYMREDFQITLDSSYRGMDIFSLFFPQLFTMFHNGEGYTGQQYLGMKMDMPLTIGTALVLGALIMIYCLCTEKEMEHKQLGKWMLGIGVIAAALTLTWVPYDRIAEKSSIMRKIFSFQFSWRLLLIVVIALVIVTCITALNLRESQYFTGYLVVLCIAMLIPHVYFLDQRQVSVDPKFYYDLNPIEASTAVVKGEYLYEESKPWNLVRDQVIAFDGSVVYDYSKRYLDLSLTCENPTEQTVRVDLPMLYYPYYHAKDVTNGQEFEPVKGIENRLELLLPAGYQGSIRVEWSEPWFWRVAELCSLITLGGMVIVYRRERNK